MFGFVADFLYGKKQWHAVAAIGSRGFMPFQIRPRAPGLWVAAIPCKDKETAEAMCRSINATMPKPKS